MAQQQVVEPAGVYEQFVVVAEDTWKLYGEPLRTTHRISGEAPIACEQISTTKFIMNFGGFEWKCRYWADTRGIGGPKQVLELHNNNHNANDTQFELYICDDNSNSMEARNPHGQLLIPLPTRFGSTFIGTFCYKGWKYLNLDIRMLKRRSILPDFTSEHVKIGHLKSNHTLKVGGLTFHLLSMHSHFFDRMFNGDFDDAKKAETELATESADPKLFQDFLLFMVCPGGCRVLPNRTNVVGLFQLARFYQVDILVETCELFLENCHEMPPWERIMAAKELGLKELKTRILNTLNTMEAWKELALKFAESEY